VINLLKDLAPPIALRLLQRLLKPMTRFEGGFNSWEEASRNGSGYEAELILAKVLESTCRVKRGEAAFERDSIIFANPDYVWPLLSALLWSASRNQGQLSVLDFGGSLGSTYFQHRRYLDSIPFLNWNVVEQIHYVEVGQSRIAEGPLRFYSDIDSCVSDQHPNTVLLSSVLQYLPDPWKVFEKLLRCGAKIIVIDRTPMISSPIDGVFLQHVPAAIYPASYPMWAFSDAKFESKLKGDWRIVSRHRCPEGSVKLQDGESIRFEGMVLEAC